MVRKRNQTKVIKIQIIQGLILPKIVKCNRCNTKFQPEFDLLRFLSIQCPGCQRIYDFESEIRVWYCDRPLEIIEESEVAWLH